MTVKASEQQEQQRHLLLQQNQNNWTEFSITHDFDNRHKSFAGALEDIIIRSTPTQTPSIQSVDTQQQTHAAYTDSETQTFSISDTPLPEPMQLTSDAQYALIKFLRSQEPVMSACLIRNAQSTAFRSWNANWQADDQYESTAPLNGHHDTIKFQQAVMANLKQVKLIAGIMPLSNYQPQCIRFSRNSIAVGYASVDSGGDDGHLLVWSMKTLREKSQSLSLNKVNYNLKNPELSIAMSSSVTTLEFCFNNVSYLASGHLDGTIRISCISTDIDSGLQWQCQTTQEKSTTSSAANPTVHIQEITNICWINTKTRLSHQYQLISSSIDGKIIKWLLDCGKRSISPLTVTDTHSSSPLSCISILPNVTSDDLQILCGHYNGMISLVDLKTGTTLMTYMASIFPPKQSHACQVTDIHPISSPNKPTISFLSTSLDGMVKLWSAIEKSASQSIRPLSGNETITCSTVLSIGNTVWTVVAMGTSDGALIFCLYDSQNGCLSDIIQKLNILELYNDAATLEPAKFNETNFEGLSGAPNSQRSNQQMKQSNQNVCAKSIAFSSTSVGMVGSCPFMTVCLDNGKVFTMQISFSFDRF